MTAQPQIILHHYPSSPFSEKVRLALGMKGLRWASVDIPVIMPKPDLTPLTGGYRRTPVMQIGADVYCDTQIILRELERRHPRPSLLPAGQEGLASGVAMWTDRAFFQVTVAVIFGTYGDQTPESFRKDREQLSGRPFDTRAMKAVAPMMEDQYRAHLSWLEERLRASASGWLFGARPGLADASAYMNLWFLRSALPELYEKFMKDAPAAAGWARRVEAIGHGRPKPMSSAEALAIARASAPDDSGVADPREPQGLQRGDRVRVAADDYGRDPVEGLLVRSCANEIVIHRNDPQAGSVHVHFPRAGFLVTRVT